MVTREVFKNSVYQIVENSSNIETITIFYGDFKLLAKVYIGLV